MPSEILEVISPKSMNLKRFVKMPLIYLLFLAGMQSGLCVVFMKLAGELAATNSVSENVGMFVLLLVLMGISAVSQSHSLNMAMKEYDQLEVMPIFQTFIMIMWMTGGMIVLNETAFYTTWQLVSIFGSFCILLAGVKVLTMKIKLQ